MLHNYGYDFYCFECNTISKRYSVWTKEMSGVLFTLLIVIILRGEKFLDEGLS